MQPTSNMSFRKAPKPDGRGEPGRTTDSALFDDFVGARQQRLRHGET